MASRPVKIQFTHEGLDKVEGALAGVNTKLDQVDSNVRGLDSAGAAAKTGLDKVESSARGAGDGLDRVGESADVVDTRAVAQARARRRGGVLVVSPADRTLGSLDR